MRVLIIGGDGMLGHQLLATLSPRHEVSATVRRGGDAYQTFGLFRPDNTFFGVDVRDIESVGRVLERLQPEAVVNAVGIVKQRDAAKDHVDSIDVNALFPHQLARACRCGRRATWSTSAPTASSRARAATTPRATRPTPADLYGRSKLLGEVADAPHCVTVRTSMIGLELVAATGARRVVPGEPRQREGVHRRAVFSGLHDAGAGAGRRAHPDPPPGAVRAVARGRRADRQVPPARVARERPRPPGRRRSSRTTRSPATAASTRARSGSARATSRPPGTRCSTSWRTPSGARKE